MGDLGMPKDHEDLEYIEQRIYQDYVASVHYDIRDPNHDENSINRNWTPYEQDLTHYPEVFKMNQENYGRYDKVKERFQNEEKFVE